MCAKREPGLKQGVYTVSMSENDMKQHLPTVRDMSPFYLGKGEGQKSTSEWTQRHEPILSRKR